MRRWFGAMSAVLLGGLAVAQDQSGQPADKTQAATAKKSAFEVISIRPSKAPGYPGGGLGGNISWATTPDGHITRNQSLRATLLMAYVPQGIAYWGKDRIQGAPAWFDDGYDISAKVAEEDVAAWQGQGRTPAQKPMLRSMLQSLLVERCKLVMHTVPSEMEGYALVLAKKGEKLTTSKPGETLPVGVPMADGGVLVPYKRGDPVEAKFYGASMAEFASHLSMLSMGRPVQDRTGLGGKYDFVMSWLSLGPDEREGAVEFSDPDPLSHWNLEKLGLRLEKIKVPTETLVIDHVERPTEN
jgi:uncharacterized protein (TIGR03435 family)